jgi:uncharacterized protein (UPF0305 family)
MLDLIKTLKKSAPYVYEQYRSKKLRELNIELINLRSEYRGTKKESVEERKEIARKAEEIKARMREFDEQKGLLEGDNHNIT